MIPTGCLGILWFQGYYDSNRMSWPHGISPISQHPSTSPNISQRFISNQLVHMVKCLSEVYSRKYILGTWKYVLGNTFSELGSMFSEIYSRNLEVCSRKYILGTWKYVLGNTFSELGSIFSEVHSRNLEVCFRKYILGTRKYVLGNTFSELGSMFSGVHSTICSNNTNRQSFTVVLTYNAVSIYVLHNPKYPQVMLLVMYGPSNW